MSSGRPSRHPRAGGGERSPVYFTRTPFDASAAYACAVVDGVSGCSGSTNIPAHSRVMVLAWLLDCFRPTPLSRCWSWWANKAQPSPPRRSVLRSLVDPNKVMLRAAPRRWRTCSSPPPTTGWSATRTSLASRPSSRMPLHLATGGGFEPRASSTPMAKSTSWKPSGRWCSTASPWSPRAGPDRPGDPRRSADHPRRCPARRCRHARGLGT